MNRTLVVGSASMLGQEIVRQLRTSKCDVITSSRKDSSDLPYDLTSERSPPICNIGPVDAMFVCAASFGNDSWDGCIANALVNTVAVYRIAQWAERLRCSHIVMAGTASSFSEAGLPLSSYGLSKAQADVVLQWAGAKAGCKTTTLRLPQLCDEMGECAKHQTWFARIVTHAWSGNDLMLAPNDQARNFVHVRDAARAMIGSWQSRLEGIHALTSPEFATYRRIAKMAYATFGAGGNVVDANDMKPFHSVSYPPASTAAWELLGEERTSLEATLQRIKQLNTGMRFNSFHRP